MGSVGPLEVDRHPPKGGQDPKMAAAFVVLLIAVSMTVLYLSSDTSPTTTETAPHLQVGPITSFEEIAGTYLRHGVGEPMYFLFLEDGTVHISSNTDLIVDRPMGIFTTTWDGRRVFITNTRLHFRCARPDQGGTYEIHVIANGNLQFVALGSDTCLERSGILLGRRFGITTAQFEPIS
jgi:hypothetical protein